LQISAHWLYVLEFVVTLLSLLLAFRAPRVSLGIYSGTLRNLRRIARRPYLSALLVAALPLVLRFALLPWIPVPQPQIQEEFSYLLGADTFAHGRLANPPHPMAVFFDNIQLIQTPRYASARPPGQAGFLCLGQVLFGKPWLGICLSVGLMCGAFYWMLRAWTRPAWALLTAFIFAIRIGVFTYWTNSYWGGSVIALGSALVVGALPRLLSRLRMRDALWFGAGCCLLASTRPFEGLALALPAAIVLLAWWIRSEDWRERRFRLVCALLPITCMLFAFFAWLAYDNFASTGHAVVSAYQLWRQQQSVVPSFLWQPLRKTVPIYYSLQTRQFNTVWEMSYWSHLHQNVALGILRVAERPIQFLQIYLRPLLLLPFLVPLLITRGRQPAAGRRIVTDGLFVGIGLVAILLGHSFPVTLIWYAWAAWLLAHARLKPGLRLLMVMLLCGAFCSLLTTFHMPTYEAPFVAPAFVLVAVGMRSLATWRRHAPRQAGTGGTGSAIVVNLSLGCGLLFLVCTVLAVFHVHVDGESPFNWSSYENRLEARAGAQRFLEQQPGKQLAIIRYGPEHDVLYEWVWNLADIDQQKVVWARELKPAWIVQLLRYYPGRKVWLIEPDAVPSAGPGAAAMPARISPYPVAGLPKQGEEVPNMADNK
jgi:hypothetical protein